MRTTMNRTMLGTICMIALLAAAAPPAAADHGSAEDAASVTFTITCSLFNPACHQLYGNYGAGIMRPCNEAWGSHWAGGVGAPAQAHFAATGACDRLSAANVTLAAARFADGNAAEPEQPGPFEQITHAGLRIACPASPHYEAPYCDVVLGAPAAMAVDGARTADLLLFP